MKKAICFIFSFITIFIITSCANKPSISVDFGSESAAGLFSVKLVGGSVAVCESASMDFDFKGNTVSACRVELLYESSESAEAVVGYWNTYSGIENASAEGSIVSFNYKIDAKDKRSSKFSGMTSAEVITEVEAFGGIIRDEN